MPHAQWIGDRITASLFVALIETYQQADGSIQVPEPLWDYVKVKVIK